MKNWIIITLLLFSKFSLAQSQKHRESDRIHSLNWDVIGSVKYNLTDQNGLMPKFSETITRFEGREFDLVGYLIPIKNGRSHSRFLLSSLPINQCYFCGQNGVPAMILVEAENSIAYTDKAIHVAGILTLDRMDSRVAPPVVLKKSKTVL